MFSKTKLTKILVLISFLTYTAPIDAENTNDNPCEQSLLSRVNRPSFSDSVCSVPYKEALIELGYQYQTLYPVPGYEHNFPNANLRVGLPYTSELSIIFPNFNHQTISPYNGFAPMGIAFKHSFFNSPALQTALEATLVPPSGSYYVGSADVGGSFNGILNYNITSTISTTVMMGVTVLALPRANGGQHFTSFNPDVVLAWTPTEKTQLYGEVNGFSNTGLGNGAGFNANIGMLYLLRHNIAIDAEVGQRISGQLLGFNKFIGTGISIQV